jgi:hypothetical protein
MKCGYRFIGPLILWPSCRLRVNSTDDLPLVAGSVSLLVAVFFFLCPIEYYQMTRRLGFRRSA